MSQRRFIQEITQKLPNNVGVSFINKKALFIDHTVYIYPLSLYAGSEVNEGLCPVKGWIESPMYYWIKVPFKIDSIHSFPINDMIWHWISLF